MTSASLCPDMRTLKDFLLGVQNQGKMELEQHLAGCRACQEAMQRLKAEGTMQFGSDSSSMVGTVQVEDWSAPPPAAFGPGSARRGRSEAGPLPAHIGRYRILEEIGAGGMGIVYKADDPQLQRVVAVKVPHFQRSRPDQATAQQRFLREARAAAQIRHPNVCPIYDVGEHDGFPYVVMAFEEGQSLADRLSGQRRCDDLGQAVALVRQMAEALQAVHSHGIIHRDLKPGNILINSAGRAILTDFGLARPTQDAEHLTAEGCLLGTPAYMAPEQARGESERIGPWTDLYSLGVVLYQMVTGRLPFEGPVATLLYKIAHETCPPPSTLRPDLDPGLAAVVTKAMAHRPENRFPDATALCTALDDWSSAWVRSARGSDPRSAVSTEIKELDQGKSTQPREIAQATDSAIAGPTSGKPRRRPAFFLALLGTVLLAAILLAVVVFTLRTRHGTLVVRIMEPDVEVVVDGDRSVIIDSKKVGRLQLIPGEHQLVVKRGKEELYTEAFTLKSGGETVIEAKWKRAESPADRPNRLRAAEWVLEAGGTLVVSVKEQARPVKAPADLPAGEFTISKIKFINSQQVTDQGLKNLRGMTELKNLNLHECGKVTDEGLKNLKGLIGLQVLNLQGTQVTGAGMRYLDEMSALKSLTLARTRVDDAGIAHIKGLPLKFLSLHLCGQVTDEALKNLQGMKSLEYLDLQGTRVTGAGMKYLNGMNDLMYLNVINTRVDDAGMTQIKRLPRLTVLHLQSAQITDAGLAQVKGMKQLTWLQLESSRLTDAGLKNLVGLSNLTILLIESNQITDTGLEHLKVLKKLSELYLRCPKIGDNGLEKLQGLTQLKKLDVKKTGVTVEGVRKLQAALPQCQIESEVGKGVRVSPLDRLQPSKVPEYEWKVAGGGDAKRAPAGLLAILGNSRLQHWGDVRSVAFHPNGHLLASGGWDGTVKLWDATSGNELHSLLGHGGYVWSVAFCPDGSMLASCGADNTIRLWDPHTGKEVYTLKAHNGGVWSIAFSRNGKVLASGGGDGTVKLWDPSTGKVLDTLKAHKARVRALALNADGTLLASGGDDGTAKLWARGMAKELFTWNDHKGAVYSLAFNPDNKTLATAGQDGLIKLRDPASGQEQGTLTGHSSYVHSVAFDSTGTLLASAGQDGFARLWNVTQKREIHVLSDHRSFVYSVAFRADGKLLASGGGDGTIKLWDAATGKQSSLTADQDRFPCVAFSPDGALLAAGTQASIRLWETATANGLSFKELPALKGHSRWVQSVAFHPHKPELVSGGQDRTTRLWDPATGKELRLLPGPPEAIWSVGFSANGLVLAIGGYGGTVPLWNTETWKQPVVVKTLDQGVLFAVALSDDGRLLASGGTDHIVKLWQTDTGKKLATLTGHGGVVRCVAVRPGGRMLASGADDYSVRLWGVGATKELHILRHGHFVFSVAFSPDGRTLASAACDGTVRLWNPDTGAAKETLRIGPSGGVINQIAFSPDGRHLASANGNGTVYILRLAPPPQGDKVTR